MTLNEAAFQLVLERWVRDVVVSVDFYRSVGFSIERQEEGFAILSWQGEQILMLGEDSNLTPLETLRGHIRVLVPDVDAKWSLVQELGSPVYREIADQPWGLRDFVILDPDGFGIRLATPLSGF